MWRIPQDHTLQGDVHRMVKSSHKEFQARSTIQARSWKGVTRLKISLVGDSGVGKSSLWYRWHHNPLSLQNATICVEFLVKHMEFESRRYKVCFSRHVATLLATRHTLQTFIWDTAGQERFHSLTRSYFRYLLVIGGGGGRKKSTQILFFNCRESHGILLV